MSAGNTVTVVLANGEVAGWSERLGIAHGTEVRYLGDRYERLCQLRDGAARGIEVQGAGELIDPWVSRTQEDLRNLDRCVGGGVARRLWEASNLGERNQLNSGFHFRLCVLLAFVTRLRQAAALVVVLDDWWFARRLVSSARAAGRVVVALDLAGQPVASGALSTAARLARDVWHGVRLQLGWLRRQARQAALARALRGDKTGEPLRGCEVLLVLWGNTHTLDEAERRVPYLGAVPGMLGEQHLRVGYLLLPVDWAQPFEDIARATLASRRPAMLLPECGGRPDTLRAVLGVLVFALLTRPRMTIAGVDVSALLRDDTRREMQDTRMSFALQMGALGRRLAARGVAPHMVVHPYENQGWEKTLRRGMRRSLPSTRIVGCMHLPAADRFVSFHPSDRDLAAGDIPDRVLVLGPAVRAGFLDCGFPADRVEVGGAVRTPDWPAALRESRPPCGAQPATGRVLVATGMSGGDSLELLGKTLPAIVELPGLRAVVNFHPQVGAAARAALRAAALRDISAADAARIEFSDAGAAQLLAEVDALVYNVSAVAFDAVIAGVPTLFVCSEVAVDLDKLPAGVSRRGRSVAEIRVALESILGADRERLAADARRAAAPVFAPVAVEPWARFARDIRASAEHGASLHPAELVR